MDLKENQVKGCKKIDLEPPNGGWGYVIVVGISFMYICSIFTTRVFGLIFGNFLSELGDEAEEISLLQSVFGTTISLMGFFTNFLLKKCPKRLVGFAGATIYFAGCCATIFVETFPQILITFSILQGIGYGIFSPVMYQSLHEYFSSSRRAFANSLVGLVCGFLSLFLPISFQYFKDLYGFRGVAAILAAISLNVFPIILLAQPVEWHLIKTTPKTNVSSNIELQDNILASTTNSRMDLVEPKTLEEGPNKIEFGVKNKFCDPELLTRIKQAIIDFLDLSLLKDLKFVNLVIGTAFMYVTESSFVMLVPSFYARRGYNNDEIVFALTIYAVANLVARIIQTITSSIFPVKCIYYVYFGSIALTILRFFFAFCTEPLYSYIVICLMGLARSWVMVYLIASLADYDIKRFPGALGLHLISVSFIYMGLGPFIGWISKTFQRDDFIILTLAIVPSFSILLWTFEFLVSWINKKKS